MKVSFLPVALYGSRAAYAAGWPSPPQLYDPALGQKAVEEMLEEAAFADEMRFDWISFSEHHYAPFIISPDPIILATAAAQRVRRAKIAVLGPTVPLHNPVRLAEQIAMLDVLSGGRVQVLFLRGIPTEFLTYYVNPEETRAMVQEASLLITKALTEPQPFGWEGRYYRYRTISVWPGTIQRPHPPLFSSGNSAESATFAARHRHGLAISFAPLAYVAQAISLYKEEAAKYGWKPTEEQIIYRSNAAIAQSDEEAQQIVASSTVRNPPRRPVPAGGAVNPAVNRFQSPYLCGSPDTVLRQLKALHDVGVGVVDMIFNIGGISHERVMNTIELFGKELLPHIHKIGMPAVDTKENTYGKQ